MEEEKLENKVMEQESVKKVIEQETVKKAVESSTKKKTPAKATKGKVLVEFLASTRNAGLTESMPISLAKALENNGKVRIIDNI